MVTALSQVVITLTESFKELCRDFLEGSFAGSRIKWRYIDEMYFGCSECLGAAENLGHVETALEVVQYQDHVVTSGNSEQITTFLFLIAQHRLMAFFAALRRGEAGAVVFHFYFCLGQILLEYTAYP